MPAADDAELLLAAGRGDRNAFGVLVERYHRTVVQFVYRFLADVDRDTAEDLTQDVFVKAWEAASGFEPRAAVLTWLLRIATNTGLNYRRWRRLRRALSLASGGLVSAPDPKAGSPEGRPARADEAERVRSAVAQLPPNQRAAIVLRHFHEMSYKDVADVLETSVPAVESLLFRARRTLERELRPVASEHWPQVSGEPGAE